MTASPALETLSSSMPSGSSFPRQPAKITSSTAANAKSHTFLRISIPFQKNKAPVPTHRGEDLTLHGTTLIIFPLGGKHLSRPVTGTRRSAPRGRLQSGCFAPVAEGLHHSPLASGSSAKLTFSSRFTCVIISQIQLLSSIPCLWAENGIYCFRLNDEGRIAMNRSRSGYVYIVLCAVIFSTMEVMLKTVHGVFAPMQITCLRFLVGGILLIPFASRSMKKKNASLSRKDIGFFALSGFLCVVIAMSLYQMSVTYTRASIVAVIFSCNPIFVTVFAHLFLHEDIHRNHIIALILELTAALIIIDPIHATLDPTGSVLAILSAVMFALYSVFGKKRTPRFGGIAVTCLSFLFGAGELVFILLFGRTAAGASLYGAVGLNLFIDVPLFENIPASAIPALLYICCINSAAGFVCHMMAMEKTSAQEASLIFFLKPIIAPIFAFLFLKEEIPLNMIVGIVCFLIGSLCAILPGILAQRKLLKAQK
ncbi:DMT family transporter [Ruminococcaceae bacterium AF10-16]|nr:DMT family transporter [Ruminococcaceae bacterium AF10-16]